MIVLLDEAGDSPFDLPWAVVLLESHDVLEGLMVPFDLALRHGMIRRAPRVCESVRREIGGELPREVAEPGQIATRDRNARRAL